MDRFDAQVLAYCQMGNRFHPVLHTRRANLSRPMRHVLVFRQGNKDTNAMSNTLTTDA